MASFRECECQERKQLKKRESGRKERSRAGGWQGWRGAIALPGGYVGAAGHRRVHMTPLCGETRRGPEAGPSLCCPAPGVNAGDAHPPCSPCTAPWACPWCACPHSAVNTQHPDAPQLSGSHPHEPTWHLHPPAGCAPAEPGSPHASCLMATCGLALLTIVHRFHGKLLIYKKPN